MVDTIVTAIIVGLAMAFGAFLDRVVGGHGFKPQSEQSAKPLQDHAAALTKWLQWGSGQHLLDDRLSVSTTDLENLRKWVLAAPPLALSKEETLAPGERERLSCWFWFVMVYLVVLGTWAGRAAIGAALSSMAGSVGGCVMAGLFGSCVAAFRSCLERRANGFEDRFGNAAPDPKTSKERFSDGMIVWFLGRPLLGAAVGAMTFIAIRSRVFGEAIAYDKLDQYPAMLIFYAWLAGLFAKTLLDLLLELTKKVFRV